MGLNLRRAAGAALLLGAYAPLHRLLDPSRAGPAGVATRQSAEAAWSVGLYGSLLVLGVAFVLSRLVSANRPRAVATRLCGVLSRPSPRAFAAGAGLVATSLSAIIALRVFDGLPTSVDEMAQLLHARALAAGALGIPTPGADAAWTIQNGILTAEGWVSIYPPLHTLALAAGLLIGAPWLVGPLAVGVATSAVALSFERLLSSAVARAGVVVLTAAPFWLLLGATHLSHTTAAATLALVLWAGLRARDGETGWAVAAGAAAGAAICSRPWIGLVCSATILGVLWWPTSGRARGARAYYPRLGAAVAGALPFAALLFWWNARLFGHALRLGYAAAFGPAHGLGFHRDPWGNVYGFSEAVAYTGADLVQLGAHLLETPLPAVALVGAGLLVRASDAGSRVLLAWVLAVLAANALYWHHGIHLGPRMMYESAPAWVGLLVASAAALTSDRVGTRVRPVTTWCVAVMGVTALVLAPGFVRSVAATTATNGAVMPPDLPPGEPALVFVHGSWSSRIAARLSAAGMRRDSVETALRRNDVCAVDRYARWRSSNPSARGTPPQLALDPLPGTPSGLRAIELSPGNVVRTSPGAAQDPTCVREALADRLGTIELEPLLWQAPPLPRPAVVVARDLGPEANAPVVEALDRRAYVYLSMRDDAEPSLLGYDEGMELLWGQQVAEAMGVQAPVLAPGAGTRSR